MPAAFSVVLVHPEIAPNTGNIIRLCANAGCDLHVIKPLGFELHDKLLRRAGLDYHEYAQLKTWDNWGQFAAANRARLFAFSTKHARKYSDVAWRPGDALVFGGESTGLPDAVLRSIPPDARVTIPMRAASRSLNLSNSVALAVYEAWRQSGFIGAK